MFAKLIQLIKHGWFALSMQVRLMLLIQGSLIIILVFAQFWIMASFERQIMIAAKGRAQEVADGVINGMNMLMLTGTINNPGNRLLFIKKMGDTKNIRDLHIIRAEQVTQQFGPGLPEEQARDEIENEVLKTGQTYTQLIGEIGKLNQPLMLRVVIPFIISRDFKGTDCLSCHRGEVGGVNGAASILYDLSSDHERIQQLDNRLWLGQIGLQLLLFVIIWYLVRAIIHPIASMTKGLNRIAEGDVAEGIHLPVVYQDEIGQATQAFNRVMDIAHELIDAQRLARSVFENSSEGIVICDSNGNILTTNRAFTDTTGYSGEEAIGKTPGAILKSGKHDKEFFRIFWDSLLKNGKWQGELWNKRKNGELFPEWQTINAVKDKNGKINFYVAVFSDITERKQDEEKIRQLAFYDALTKLPNRRLLNDRLKQAIASSKRSNRYGALMFLDLDNFKPLNDTHGHDVGDLLLIEVANRLTRCVREVDTVARFGGDEFVVMLSELDTDETLSTTNAGIVAEKIRKNLAEPYFLNLHQQQGEQSVAVEHHCTTSIGVVLFISHKASMEDFLKWADMAMFQAKEAGRNQIRFYAPSA
jgi:diguanylate cyclase (GGDEF)-like protein/PAS domain S-box-containing protein